MCFLSTLVEQASDDAVILQVRPRFPLFGGWKTQYTLGYNLPSYEVLSRSGSEFELSIRFVVCPSSSFLCFYFMNSTLRITSTTTW